MARDFCKIVAWQKADDLVVEVYDAMARFFPRGSDARLEAQRAEVGRVLTVFIASVDRQIAKVRLPDACNR